MNKIYIAWEHWEGYGEHQEHIRGIFRTKEEAEAVLEEWRRVRDVIGEDRACFYHVTEEQTISEKHEVGSCYPKKLVFSAELIGDDNKIGRLHLTKPEENPEPEEKVGDIRFVSYEDTCLYKKGRIKGLIDFVPEESHKEHVERARKKIEDNLKKIVPQEVREAKVKKDGSTNPFLKLGRKAS